MVSRGNLRVFEKLLISFEVQMHEANKSAVLADNAHIIFILIIISACFADIENALEENGEGKKILISRNRLRILQYYSA